MSEVVECVSTSKKVIINGKAIIIITSHPILEPEEKERRHQNFLRTAERILNNLKVSNK